MWDDCIIGKSLTKAGYARVTVDVIMQDRENDTLPIPNFELRLLRRLMRALREEEGGE